MDVFKLGIPYLDQNLPPLEKGFVYLVKSNFNRFSQILMQNSIQEYLKNNLRVLVLSSQNPSAFLEEGSFLGFDYSDNIRTQRMVILEIPADMPQIIAGQNNLAHVLDDIHQFIQSYHPQLIIVDSLRDFTGKSGISQLKSTVSRILSYFNELSITVLMNISDYDLETLGISDKLAHAVFTFNNHLQQTIQTLQFDHLRKKSSQEILFSFDSLKFFMHPKVFISPNVSINEIDYVLLHPIIAELKEHLVKYLSKQTNYIFYENKDDLKEKIKNESKSILFLPMNLDDLNGMELSRLIRSSFINIKIVLVASRNYPPNQKVRAIRLGVNRFMCFPIKDSDVKEMLLSLFPPIQNNDNNYQIAVIFKRLLNIHTDLSQNIYYEAIYRVLKDFAQQNIEKAHSMQFFKVTVTELERSSLIHTFKENANLLALLESNENKTDNLIAIYDNLSDKMIYRMMQKIQVNMNNRLSDTKNASGNLLKNLIFHDNYHMNQINTIMENSNRILLINYPYDETNIDQILKRIF